MQKFSLLTFVCCLMLAFTACKKETLLETKQDLNPTNLTTKNGNSKDYSSLVNSEQMETIQEALDADLDVADSLSLFNLLAKENKKNMQDESTACFGPITGICGAAVTYTNSCYYRYQIWNDPTNLVVDLYFPSSLIGWKQDSHGRWCQYYVTPCIGLDLYNANGTKIGTVNVANSNISVQETRILFNINTLKTQYPGLTCVKLSGSFYAMKKCSNCNAQRVSTVCITPKKFCLQQCPALCPTVSNISLDRLKVCGSGAIKGIVSISGDANETTTTWTYDGQTTTGNIASISLPLNNTCIVQSKVVNVKVTCNKDQSVLAERSFDITVNPALTASISTDFVLCQAYINLSCEQNVPDISWTYGNQSGTGKEIPLGTDIQTLNYVVTSNGCAIVGTAEGLYCEPL